MRKLIEVICCIVVFGLVVWGITSCENSEFMQRTRKEQADRELREQTPRVIREADGCKVYTFKSGDRYHYFTRCPESRTTTDSSWQECRMVGKVNQCETKSESIEVTR